MNFKNHIFIDPLIYKYAIVQALQTSIHQQSVQTGNPELGVQPRAVWELGPASACC